MADTAASANPRPDNEGPTPARRPRNWISVGLVAVTLGLAASCIFILSSVLQQARLASITIDGVNLSVRRLVSVGDQWKNTREQIGRQVKLRDAARDDSIKLNLDQTNARSEVAAKKEHLDLVLQMLHRRVDASLPAVAALKGKGYPDQIAAIEEAKPQLHKDHPELDAFTEHVFKAYDEYTAADSAYDSAVARFTAVTHEIIELSASIDVDTKNLNSAFDLIKKDMDAASRAKVENALYEMYFNRELTTRAGNALISMEPDNLTLLLVIMMGVLGAALQMTHAYCVKNQAITFPGYLLRISLGAITALVMFIVAKAGVPVVTDAARLGGDAPINPYFVAFLAINSGLLSEAALANVQAQGARLLGKGPEAPDRWARHDLNEDLKAQAGLSAADLARHLGIDATTMNAMLKGEKAMDDAAQKLTSIYLRGEQRDLFTDMPPPKP